MSTLVYAPGIKIYIDTKIGPVDVSEDIISGRMSRRADAVSDMSFSLNNARRKYDRLFSPNDRIVVVMKRLAWVRVFTGYLNEVPLFTSWPRVVDLTASCSLKRLQYYLWDPTLMTSYNLVNTALVNDSGNNNAPDGGIANVIRAVLEKVVDWSGAQALDNPKLEGSKVHIGGIPKDWFSLVAKVAARVEEARAEEVASALQLAKDVGAVASVAGTPVDSSTATGTTGGTIAYGTYGNFRMSDPQQATNATAIVQTVLSLGGSRLQAEMALACAMQESTLKILNYGDRAGPDSRGLYQQRDNGAWGSLSDRMNPAISTTNFFNVLKNNMGGEFWEPIYKTQRCAKSLRKEYAKWQGAAEAMTAAYYANTTGTAATNATTGSTGKSTGANFAATARNIATSRSIPYGHGTSGTEENPRELDCSAFVRHAFMKTTGSVGTMPRRSSDIMAWAQRQGRSISVEEARRTPGALIAVTNNGSASGVHHIEISMGNGQRVGAHQTGVPASVKKMPSGYFNIAATVPGLSYNSDAVPEPPPRTAASGSGTSGRVITDKERTSAFSFPGDTSNRTDYKTPWGFTVRGLHRSIAGVFAAACEEANRVSTWRPKQIQCLPPNDETGLPRRLVRGGTEWSLHSYGLAFDMFDSMNPTDVWGPAFAPDEAFRNAFKRHGFRLGAEYKNRKDYPHIEWAAAPPDGTTGTPAPAGDVATTAAADDKPSVDELLGKAKDLDTDVSTKKGELSALDSIFGNAEWIATPPDASGSFFMGTIGIANDTAVLPYIASLCKSTLRSFCSAPNGDFIAWFPDYYGKWGTAAKMVLQPIEVKDFSVTWNDEHLITHQFVSGVHVGGNALNAQSGDVQSLIGFIQPLITRGIATIETPGIMSLIFGEDISEEEQDEFVRKILGRFGARVDFQEIPGITGPTGSFFMAVFLFMQGWAFQFNASIQTTFMPELYPGMLVQFPAYDFQAYVVGVEHSWDFNSGFSTSINISSPARITGKSNDDLFGLPIATPSQTEALAKPIAAKPKPSAGGKTKPTNPAKR